MQYSELLGTSPSVFQPVFPLHTKTSVHEYTLDSSTTSNIFLSQGYRVPPPRKFIHRETQRTRATAQVTTWTHRSMVWFLIHPTPAEMTAHQTCFGTSHTHLWSYGLPYNSLQQRHWRIQKRTSELPATNTPD